LRFVRSIVETEINSVTDNPIIFPDDDSVISAGNFHGQPIAIALDLLGLALAEACTFSERRIDKLLSGLNPKLPLFLTTDAGLSSGMMVLQYTAAALISKNSILATPAGLGSASVSAGQEDHASMGVTSALKAREIIEIATKVVAIELICASQAVDLLGVENLGTGTSRAVKQVRKITKHLDKDRSLSDDLDRLSKYLSKDEFTKIMMD
ncbi:MAG: aromatic amino acid lyase, partial [Thaumarchaeota archaeon]|nr:aromatic amino acid lyase [Nitrososphaerota archaeon]